MLRGKITHVINRSSGSFGGFCIGKRRMDVRGKVISLASVDNRLGLGTVDRGKTIAALVVGG